MKARNPIEQVKQTNRLSEDEILFGLRYHSNNYAKYKNQEDLDLIKYWSVTYSMKISIMHYGYEKVLASVEEQQKSIQFYKLMQQ